MKRVLGILTLVAAWPVVHVGAQLEAPNQLGVAMGHIHLLVKDVEANKKYFAMLGGSPVKVDEFEGMKFPGVLILLTPGNPTPLGKLRTQVFCGCPDDGLEMSMINHVGFNVKNYDEAYEKFKAAGYRIEDFHNAKGRSFFFSPDGLMLEIAQSRNLTTPAGEFHIHSFVNDMPPKDRDHQIVPWEMFLWYQKMFGVKLMGGGPGSGLGDDIPGARLRISQTRLPVEPTKGHVVDHVGFEVKNLEAFARQLEGNGVKLDQPYSATRHKSFASAQLVDPWGTTIELTEGLNKF